MDKQKKFNTYDKIIYNQMEINKLKENLMNKNNNNKEHIKKDCINKTIYSLNSNDSTSEYYKIKNSEVGLDFERNIRNILNIYYGWEKGILERHFFFRYIIYKEKEEIIITNQKKKIKVEDKEIIYKLNENKSLDIFLENKKVENIIDNNSRDIKLFDKYIITLSEIKEFEADGIFNIKNFGINKFDKKDISIIYKNFEEKDISSNVVLEVKLNKKKIGDLINQLIDDKKIIDKITTKQFLFVGFINSNKIDIRILDTLKSTIKLNKLKLIIYGINNSMLCGKMLCKFYDWETIKEAQVMKKRLNKMEGKMNNIEKNVEKMQERIDNIEKKVDKMQKKMQKKMDNVDQKLDGLIELIKNMEKKDDSKKEKSLLKKKRK